MRAEKQKAVISDPGRYCHLAEHFRPWESEGIRGRIDGGVNILIGLVPLALRRKIPGTKRLSATLFLQAVDETRPAR